jgi:hypothetical protein
MDASYNTNGKPHQMKNVSDYLINEKESVKDTVGPNTLVLARKDARTLQIVKCGVNCNFLNPGQTLNPGNVEELSGKGWEIRYSDTIPQKQDGPKSSGKAGVPQKD